MKSISILALVAALFLSACRPGVPTSTAIQPSPTILRPSSTRTPASSPARTPSPTLTQGRDKPATARAILTQSADSRIMLTSRASLAGTASLRTAIAKEASWTATSTMYPESIPDPEKFDVKTSSFPSPDRKWEAKILTAFPSEDNDQQVYFTQLKVSRTDGSREWVVINEWLDWGLGYSLPGVLGWSRDDRYLYAVDKIIPDGCQPPGGYHDNLRRVDLQSGQVEQIIENGFGSIALSQDGEWVIFIEYEGAAIVVFDLLSMDEQRIEFEPGPNAGPYWFVGKFTWSPDGKRVLFPIYYGDPCFTTGSKLLIADLQEQSIQTIIEKSERIFTVLEWTEPDSVQLVDQDGRHWQLDLSTGELETH